MTMRANAWAEFLLAEVADLRGRYEQAKRGFRRSEEQALAASEWSLAAVAAYRLGRVASAQGQFSTAEQHLGRCIETCTEHGVNDGWAGSLLSLAWIARHRGATTDGVRAALEEALERALVTHDHQIQSAAHRQLGFLAWDRLQNRAEAENHYAAAQTISTEKQEVKELGAITAELGYLASEWNDLESAELHCWRSLEIAMRIGDAHLLASAYWNIGRVADLRGDYEGAEHWYERSRTEQELIGNPTGTAVATLALARVRRLQGDMASARTTVAAARRIVETYEFVELLDDIDEEERAHDDGHLSDGDTV